MKNVCMYISLFLQVEAYIILYKIFFSLHRAQALTTRRFDFSVCFEEFYAHSTSAYCAINSLRATDTCLYAIKELFVALSRVR